MATVLLIGALAYFSASLAIALMAGRFISLQDVERDTIEPDQQHWCDEMPIGQGDAGDFQDLMSYRDGDCFPIASGMDFQAESQAPSHMEEKPDADT